MKHLILIGGIVAALVLGFILLCSAVLYLVAGDFMGAFSMVLGGMLCLSQVIVFRYVAERIGEAAEEEPKSDKDVDPRSNLAGTPWAENPGHTKD